MSTKERFEVDKLEERIAPSLLDLGFQSDASTDDGQGGSQHHSMEGGGSVGDDSGSNEGLNLSDLGGLLNGDNLTGDNGTLNLGDISNNLGNNIGNGDIAVGNGDILNNVGNVSDVGHLTDVGNVGDIGTNVSDLLRAYPKTPAVRSVVIAN